MRSHIIFKNCFAAALITAALFTGYGKIIMAHEWMAPADEGKRVNPTTADQKSITQGKRIYLDYCAVCHGEKIEGMKAEKAGIETDSPDLKQRLRTHTDGDFFWKITHGRGDMPSFKDDLSDREIWDVINYIRSESE